MWMSNNADRGKRLWLETFHVKDWDEYVVMDTKADDTDLFREFKRQRKTNLITCCRPSTDKSPHRNEMIEFMEK